MANSDIWNMEKTTQSFFTEVSNYYGLETKEKMKKILIANKKLVNLRTRNSFLIQCRRHKILTKSLILNLKGFKHSIGEGVISRLSKTFSTTLQNEVINELFRRINKTVNDINSTKDDIKDIIPHEMFIEFERRIKKTHDELRQKKNKEHEQKFNKLLRPEIKNFDNQWNRPKWIKNITGKSIPQPVQNILGLGHKFNLPIENKKTPVNEIIASLEPTIQRLENTDHRVELRNKLCNILTNHKRMRSNKTTGEIIMNKQYKETKKFLENNPDIIVLNADKGNTTVLMKKDDYLMKMQTLLDDENTYRRIASDPTKKIQSKCNRLISNWKNENFISQGEARKLRRYNAVIAKMYGTIKIHKDGEPPRPVVASMNSPTYNLAKMYANILRNVTGKTRRSVKNSLDFKENMNNVRLPEGYILVSLDVISLFTKIPKEMVYEEINRQWFQIKKYTKIPKNEFMKGVKLVMENCTFSFNGVIYEQIFGSPMGSPISPVLADLVLERLETESIKKLKFRLPFFNRFVDDILTACPDNRINELTDVFNNYDMDGNIRFTHEVEIDKQLPFLDTLVIRQDNGSIRTNWYHKETWSGRYLNFFSHLPFSYKRNTITILTDKIMKLADTEFHESNFSILTKTLKENGYPEKLIQSTINMAKKKTLHEKRNDELVKNQYVSVPYVKGAFEKIKITFDKHNIKVVGKGNNNLKKHLFTRIKDTVPINLQSGLVYKVKCSCSKVYVGQTIQYLEKRMADHQYNINIKNSNHSALCDHIINQEPNTEHIVNWDDIEIIHRENKQLKRDVLEMIYIKTTPNTMNKQNECKYLSNTYNNIIK